MNNLSKIKDITFIGAYPNLASDSYCDRMIEGFHKVEEQMSSYRGDESNGKENRKDFSVYYNWNTNQQIEGIKDLSEETNRILDLGLKKYVEEYPSLAPHSYYSIIQKIQRTPPKGGFHNWHSEHGPGQDDAFRMLTWTIYLNDVPEGEGETEFLEYGIKVQPKKGTVCYFPAAWTHTHRGNAVYTHDKYIATGWYYFHN